MFSTPVLRRPTTKAVPTRTPPVRVAGGGTGGPAAALALSRRAPKVEVPGQAAQLGRTGAGIQLGPSTFSAFDLYPRLRIARTARIVLGAPPMGRIVHAKGVERLVRNERWKRRTPQRFQDTMEWP